MTDSQIPTIADRLIAAFEGEHPYFDAPRATLREALLAMPVGTKEEMEAECVRLLDVYDAQIALVRRQPEPEAHPIPMEIVGPSSEAAEALADLLDGIALPPGTYRLEVTA